MKRDEKPIEALIVAVPESAGSALYGMVDVLSAAGTVWQSMVRADPHRRRFRARIVAPTREPFRCGNGVPVEPDQAFTDFPQADHIVMLDFWLEPDEDFKGRYPELMAWLRSAYRQGASLYAACSGSVMLAETGLLDGCEATSHWGYMDLFRKRYPQVRFRPEPALVFADRAGRIATAGGVTSWHDLAIHIISRHLGPGEALRVAKVFLLKLHDEGQLPYASLIRNEPHADAVVRGCQEWLKAHCAEHDALAQVVASARIPERTLARRFKTATGTTLIEYLQNLRVETAKRLLETTDLPIDAISARAGYEDASFFRRLFKRGTGLTPGQYRRMFRPVMASDPMVSVDPKIAADQNR